MKYQIYNRQQELVYTSMMKYDTQEEAERKAKIHIKMNTIFIGYSYKVV
jgi:hypothetical protein